MKKCCVIGLGYIGLPTATILANNNYLVEGIDINKDVVNSINKSKVHFIEKGLQGQLEKAIKSKRLHAKTKPSEADIYLIAVPTPFIESDSPIPKPDLSHIYDSINSIAPLIKKGDLIIIESTCPVGTTEGIVSRLENISKITKEDIFICYCPERVIPGNILSELINNNRIIGGINHQSAVEGENFYKTFCKGELIKTNSNTAEMVKLSENAFRDVNIAFANELSILCEGLNINIYELISLANQHPRVNILDPGCGVGGHCIAVDPWFIVSDNKENAELIKQARFTNLKKNDWVFKKIIKVANELELELKRKPIIGFMGISFKANIDDIRESPALKIVQKFYKLDKTVKICDPNINSLKNIPLSSLDETINQSDLIIILVAHDIFKNINILHKKVIDFCGLLKK